MKILGIRRLRGPNVYLDRPVAVARLRLDELTGRETSDLEGFTERLLRALPGLAEHHCAAGAPGGFVSRMRGGTYFGHVTEHVSIELSQRIGRDVSFGRTVSAGEPGLYDVIVECPQDESPESPLAAELLDAAAELVTAVAAGDCPPGAALAARVAALTELAEREAIGPSTRSIIAAARGRGIPVERYADLSLLRLGWGNRRRLAWAAMTDRTGGVGVDIAADKQVTRRLLEEAGVPVAAGGAARTAAEAVRLLTVLGAPVVVKPAAAARAATWPSTCARPPTWRTRTRRPAATWWSSGNSPAATTGSWSWRARSSPPRNASRRTSSATARARSPSWWPAPTRTRAGAGATPGC